MGTQRVEAFLQCRSWELETNDHALMTVICHKWNDGQIRELDISFSDLLDYLPYRGKKYGYRTLQRSLRRLVDLGVLIVEHNGRRYLQDRWLHIHIVWQEFWDELDAQKARKKEKSEKSVQPRLLESRALSARPESTRVERASEVHEVASRKSTRVERASEVHEVASHSSTKDLKDLRPKKDPIKAAAPLWCESSPAGAGAENGNGAPREVLVPAAALDDPAAVEAVFNTLTIADDAAAVEKEDLLSDEYWHERARTARDRGELLPVVLADLVLQRWPDLNRRHRVTWQTRMVQLCGNQRAAGRRGRQALDDILAASCADDKDAALVAYLGRWVTAVEGVEPDGEVVEIVGKGVHAE